MNKKDNGGTLLLTSRNIYFDLMRIFACFHVIFQHTLKHGRFLFLTVSPTTFYYWIYSFFSIFSGVAVPLFFAISGALLIPKDNEPLKVVLKRVVRIIIVLLIFSLFYYFITLHIDKKNIDISYFFRRLYSKDWNFTYWYLYAYIAYLTGLPLLRNLCKNLSNKHFYYMFSIAFFIKTILPFINFLAFEDKLFLNNNLLANWLAIDTVLFPCLGYFLEYRIKIDNNFSMKLAKLVLLDILLISFATYMGYERSQLFNKPMADVIYYQGTTVMLNCITVYLVVKSLITKNWISEYFNNMIVIIGECTFGIYLLHFLFLRQLPIIPETKNVNLIWDFFNITLGFNPLITAYIVVAIVLFIGFIITFVLRKVPLIRKII